MSTAWRAKSPRHLQPIARILLRVRPLREVVMGLESHRHLSRSLSLPVAHVPQRLFYFLGILHCGGRLRSSSEEAIYRGPAAFQNWAVKYPASVRQRGPPCHRYGSLHFLSWPSNMNLLVPLILKILYTSLHIQSPEKCQCKMFLPNEIKHFKFKHALPHYLGLKLCILPDYVAFIFVLSNWEKLTDFQMLILHWNV